MAAARLARGASGGQRSGSLWDSDLVAGVAFHPRKCARNSKSGAGSGWVDSEIKLNDGTVLAYRLYLPPPSVRAPAEECSNDAKACVLIYFHANAELCTDLETEIGLFFECGFAAVLCPEFRGYAWSTGKPRLSALGPDAEAVTEALSDILGSAGVQDPGSVIAVVHGRSLGSVCAVHVAARFGGADGRVRGLIMESGVVSLLSLPMVRQLGAMMPQMLQMLSMEPEPLRSLEKMEEVCCPTIVFHGDQDEIVPVSQAVAAHRACASDCKKLVRYPRVHHNDLRQVAGQDYYAELTTLRKVAAGELPSEAFTQPLPPKPGVLGAVLGAFKCFPGVRRCLSGDDSNVAQ